MPWGRPFRATLVRQRFGDRFSLLGGVGYPYQPPPGKEPCHEPPSHLSPPWGQSHRLPEKRHHQPRHSGGRLYHVPRLPQRSPGLPGEQRPLPLPRQRGPAGDGEVLLHRLRGRLPLHQRQPRLGVPVHLSLPHLLHRVGAGWEAGHRGLGQQGGHRPGQRCVGGL